MSAPVPIVLPPEPPRDRVVEAVDQDGEVVELWTRVSGWWRDSGDDLHRWVYVVHEAMANGWSLRHVAAESGEPWFCLITGHGFNCGMGLEYPSRAEAESAAIAHLADVHSIVPVEAEKTGEVDVRHIGEALLDVLPEVYGYRVGDEPANLDGALGRDAEKIAARLRSAGEGATE